MKKGLVVGLILLALATSGLGSMPGSSTRSGQNASASSLQFQSAQAAAFTNQVILKYKPLSIASAAPAKAAQMARLDAAAGVSMQYFRGMSGDANVLSLPASLPLGQVQAISRKLMALPEVEYAEPDQILFPALAPTDPLYSSQWALQGANGINAVAAWDITTGSSSIVIADIDTGITSHEDLLGRTVPGYDFITQVPRANDGDGRDPDPGDPGDWLTGPEIAANLPVFSGCSTQAKSSWHGTHTAGIIGAAADNGLGVAGVNWNSMILPVRVLGKCGGFTSDVLDGLTWAAGLPVIGVPDNTHPAKVLNLSLGEQAACSTAWQTAIDNVIAAGTVVVAAAGNSSLDLAAHPFTPASCNGVISVAATNFNGGRANYSNFGAPVKISAPGGEQDINHPTYSILSTFNSGLMNPDPALNTYAYDQGTSMAAPHVTGVASLMFSLNPFLLPSQVLQILQNTARAFPTGSTCSTSICGSGILDAGAAVNAVPAAITDFSPTSGLTGDAITIHGANFARASEVQFNGLAASFTVLSATEISAIVPAGDTAGLISVTNPGGTVTSVTSFTLLHQIFLPLVAR